MLARYYSSSLGRFMAVDPVNDTTLENPQSWNKYTYVRSNPIAYNDPRGTRAQAHSVCGSSVHCSGRSSDNVGAEPGEAGSRNPIRDRRNLADQMARVPGPVRKAIPDLVRASNSPSGKDTRGGFHEESLVWGRDASGAVVVSISVSGPYSAPDSDHAETSFEPADPEVHKKLVSIEGFVHVHPRGGGNTHFRQEPSEKDINKFAKGASSVIHIVVGAYSRKVYFFDEQGTIGEVKLKDFKP